MSFKTYGGQRRSKRLLEQLPQLSFTGVLDAIPDSNFPDSVRATIARFVTANVDSTEQILAEQYWGIDDAMRAIRVEEVGDYEVVFTIARPDGTNLAELDLDLSHGRIYVDWFEIKAKPHERIRFRGLGQRMMRYAFEWVTQHRVTRADTPVTLVALPLGRYTGFVPSLRYITNNMLAGAYDFLSKFPGMFKDLVAANAFEGTTVRPEHIGAVSETVQKAIKLEGLTAYYNKAYGFEPDMPSAASQHMSTTLQTVLQKLQLPEIYKAKQPENG